MSLPNWDSWTSDESDKLFLTVDPTTPGTSHPAPSVYTPPIVQSPNDKRSYRIVKLHNDLQAILVSDPETDKAAASLSVGVGHLSDPDERPGLAHFCEHLLFMGTEQYPKENEYGEYVESNGGRTNAYTATNNTNYYFSVSSPALYGALQRFSSFFHSPLFSPSCTVRELQAVDSENKKNQQSDLWRIFQLDKGLSQDGARWSKFGSGNWVSLMHTDGPKVKENGAAAATEAKQEEEGGDDGGAEGQEVRAILLDWYAKHYSANRMTLAVYGQESLDDLTKMVTELFSPIPNRGLTPMYDETTPVPPLNSPWGAAQEGSTVFAKTVMDLRALEMRWVIPSQIFRYKQQPLRVLTHLIGHESAGSIASILKKKGWITELTTSRSSGDIDNGFDFIRVGTMLTPEGLENYASIVETVHAYISLLQTSLSSSSPTPFSPYHFTELHTVAGTSFRFAEKSPAEGYVTSLSEQLAKPLARADVLSANTLMYGEWDDEARKQVLDVVSGYLGRERARVSLMTRGEAEWARVKVEGKPFFANGKEEEEGVWEKEKWYGTQYVVKRVDTRVDGKVLEGLGLPAPNAFIPKNFEVEKREVKEVLKRPLKIRESSLSTLWYKKDDQFWVPKASFTLFVRSPLASITPRNAVLTRLFTELLADALTERTYDADLAGLTHHIGSNMRGLSVSVGGYSDKLSVLLETLLREMKSFVVKDREGRFGVYKEQLRQEWENALLEQPAYLSEIRTAQLIRERAWSEQEKIDELATITMEDLQNHITNMLSRTHVEALIHGNVARDDAMLVIKQVEELLGSKNLTPAERLSMRCHILPQGSNLVYDAPVPNKDDVNSSLTYYCQIGDPTDKHLAARLHLLAQIAKEPAFNQLRTKEQLGYMVFSGYWSFVGTMGFKITVQSERTPVYLETRVDAFLDTLKGIIDGMTDEEFEKQKQSLIDRKLTKLKNLHEEAQRFVGHIDDGYFDFLRREHDVEILKTLKKSDVQSLLMTYVHPSSPTRAKLSVHLCSQQTPSPRVSLEAAHVLLGHFKAAGIPVKEKEFNESAAMQLSVAIHQKAWVDYFEKDDPGFDKKIAKELVDLIAKVAKQYPMQDEASKAEGGDVKLREGTVYIESVPALKRKLLLGPAAIPVENYSDLAGSKL